MLLNCPALHECVVDWALRLADRCHSKSVPRLSRVQNGWHFSALHTSVEQIQEFRLEDFVVTVQAEEPGLWRTVTNLLAADNKLTRRRSSLNLVDNLADADAKDDDEDKEQFWVGLDTGDVGAGESDPDNPRASVLWSQLTKDQRHTKIISLVCPPTQNWLCLPNMPDIPMTQKAMWIISIAMHSSNQKCNALQSIFRTFLHSCNTLQKVIQALARMGCLISVNSINQSIRSLSAQTYENLGEMGQSLQVS